MNKSLKNTLILLSIFSVAMAFLESAVVIYLRELLYPSGFSFPLTPMKSGIALTELLRELATLIMLVSIGLIAGKNSTGKFAWFFYCFGIWDIFYYVFLRLLIRWPASWFTWDILFLLPVTWTGPVLAPLLTSGTMVVLALVMILKKANVPSWKPGKYVWTFLILGALIIFTSFILDYSMYILQHFKFSELWNLPSSRPLYDLTFKYVPNKFNWWIFGSGELIIVYVISRMWSKNMKQWGKGPQTADNGPL